MTCNISYLSDYELFDGGYVSFGQGGCKITGKGTIKTDKLEFENVYFVKDLKQNLVRGLPTKYFENDHTCNACLKRKQDKASFMTGDFSRFTWTFFLKTKDETSGILKKFITEIENLKDLKVKIIRCDNGVEFRNKEMNDFCSRKWIKREFSNARTPQQNGVAERRNRTLIEAARTMLADAKLPVTFWAEAVNTACYVQNRVHDALLESTSSNAQDTCKADAPESSENPNPTASITNPSTDQMETITVETPIPTVNSPVSTDCYTDSQEPSSETRLILKMVTNQEETPSLDNILTLTN
nr:putative ribonuclease H-like domain-containing protein [Tanacetum cinerariifolium]